MKVYVSIFTLILLLNLTTITPAKNGKIDLDLNFNLIPEEECKDFFEDYKIKMGKLESNNNYKIVNRYGYLGKYQFGKKTLKGLIKEGYLKTDNINDFLKDPELQEKAMDALINCNLDYISRNNLNKYIGQTIGGISISLTGLLAGSHLVGPYAVKRYLKTNGRVIKKDANGTSVKDYMKALYME